MLATFDSDRDRILLAAAKLYARGRKGSYELGVADMSPDANAHQREDLDLQKALRA